MAEDPLERLEREERERTAHAGFQTLIYVLAALAVVLALVLG